MLREFCVRAACDIHVIAPRQAGSEPFDAALGRTVTRVGGIEAAGSKRGYVPGLALATLRVAKRFRPDVILAGHVLAAPGPLWLRRTRSTPLVVATYGVELVAPRLQRFARFVLPRADRVLAVSGFTMNAARALGAGEGEVIPVGAPDPRDVAPDAIAAFRKRFGLEDGRILLTVARLEPHKGIDVVINVLEDLPQDVRYLVVGSGPAQAAFAAVAARQGMSDRVVFAGGLSDDDLAAAFRAADAFVLASRSLNDGKGGVEGCPVALLEAAAYGLPIVAGNTGGIADAVRDGVTGLLADPENASDITRALNRALDPTLAKPLADAAEKSAKAERNWSVVVERIERLLAEAAGIRNDRA